MGHRIEQINKLIRRELSELIQRQLKDPRLSTFVTVTEVATSTDLRHAKVFVSHLGSDEEKQAILEVLDSAAGFLRKELAHNLKLRRTPELHFYWDDSIEQGDHILQLIDQVTQDEVGHQPESQPGSAPGFTEPQAP
jgi:ribosome-binding factor A